MIPAVWALLQQALSAWQAAGLLGTEPGRSMRGFCCWSCDGCGTWVMWLVQSMQSMWLVESEYQWPAECFSAAQHLASQAEPQARAGLAGFAVPAQTPVLGTPDVSSHCAQLKSCGQDVAERHDSTLSAGHGDWPLPGQAAQKVLAAQTQAPPVGCAELTLPGYIAPVSVAGGQGSAVAGAALRPDVT